MAVISAVFAGSPVSPGLIFEPVNITVLGLKELEFLTVFPLNKSAPEREEAVTVLPAVIPLPVTMLGTANT